MAKTQKRKPFVAKFYASEKQLPAVLTVFEAASYSRQHPETIRRHIRDGLLVGENAGVRALRIKREDLLAYLSPKE